MDTVQHTLNILLDFFFFFGLELSGNNGRAAPKSTTRHAWHVNVHTFSLSFHHLLHSNHHHQPTQSAAIPSRRTLIIPETTHSFIHFILFYRQSIHPPVITGMPTSFSSVVRQIRDSALMDRR